MTALLPETASNLTKRLIERLNQRQPERLTRPVLRDLVRTADVLAGVVLSTWAWVRETLEGEGFEGGELAQYCRVLLDGIEESLAGHEQLRALAEEAALTPREAGLPDLEAKLPALREARPKVAEAFDLATRAARPIDEAKLAESRRALDRGESTPLEDYLARLGEAATPDTDLR